VNKPKTSNKATVGTRRGRLLVLSAPSGGGKTTVSQEVIARTPGLTRAITYTTRPRRPGEENGRDYHFLDEATFERKREQGEFLEWAVVHGYRYGTARRDVEERCEAGLDVLLVIDYQGAATLRRQQVDAIYVFLLPPSLDVLEQRLRLRNADDETTLRARLAAAPHEMAQYHWYDYVIINEDLEVATQQLQAIVLADRCRVERLNPELTIISQLDGCTHESGATV
jgi:guanylate kinase